MIRRDFPERFEEMAKLSEALGARLTKVRGNRIFLRELPEGYGNYEDEPEVQCGAFCHAATDEIRTNNSQATATAMTAAQEG